MNKYSKKYNCIPIALVKAKGDNYICAGYNPKPSKFKKDIIMLSLKGKVSNTNLEMTKEEAALIIHVLTDCLCKVKEK